VGLILFMRIIPVIDLLEGRAVLARGGVRSAYRPVESLLYQGDDPLGLALAYREVFGLDEIYLADLDAIEGGTPAVSLVRSAANASLRLWVDAGVREPSRAKAFFEAGAARVIAATETLTGPSVLERLVKESPSGAVVFGLDLRGGRPLLAHGHSWPTVEPEALIDVGLAAGVERLLILDLERVGSGTGVGGLDLAGRVARARQGVEVAVGGGVSSRSDLIQMEAIGISAVLVGSALHDGRLTKRELAGFTGR
jgi:phosphoribosylformimino-5-aminoimidazole carboxamide ribotide isomerase